MAMSDPARIPMQTPQDLFIHELSAMHDAELTFAKTLKEAQGLVQDPTLQQGLAMHAEQSQQHAQRLQQVIETMGAQPHPVKSHAAKGMQKELKEAISANPSPQVIDGLATGGAAKTEHFEIAAYTGLIEKARAMGQPQIAQLLEQNLQDEQQMLQQVEQISQKLTQQMAAMSASQQGQQPFATAD